MKHEPTSNKKKMNKMKINAKYLKKNDEKYGIWIFAQPTSNIEKKENQEEKLRKNLYL